MFMIDMKISKLLMVKKELVMPEETVTSTGYQIKNNQPLVYPKASKRHTEDTLAQVKDISLRSSYKSCFQNGNKFSCKRLVGKAKKYNLPKLVSKGRLKGCELGEVEACIAITDQSKVKKDQLINKAIEIKFSRLITGCVGNKNKFTCHSLAGMVEKAAGPEFSKKYYQMACNLGLSKDCGR